MRTCVSALLIATIALAACSRTVANKAASPLMAPEPKDLEHITSVGMNYTRVDLYRLNKKYPATGKSAFSSQANDFDKACWVEPDVSQDTAVSSATTRTTPPDYYVRFTVAFLKTAGQPKSPSAEQAGSQTQSAGNGMSAFPPDLDEASNGRLTRWLFGENNEFSVALKAEVGGTPMTIPLFVATHTSNYREGEGFDTRVTPWHESVYIRASDRTPFSISVLTEKSNTYSTEAISAALRIANLAVKSFAPQARFLSVYTKQNLHKQAQILDAALSQSLKETVSETAPVQVYGGDFQKGCGVVSVVAPGTDLNILQNELDPKLIVGQWLVAARDKRYSLFFEKAEYPPINSPTAIIGDNATASTILGTPVGVDETHTVGSEIKVKAGTEITAWAAATGNDVDAKALVLCGAVRKSLYDLGLTGLDAEYGLAAMIQGMAELRSNSANYAKLKDRCFGDGSPKSSKTGTDPKPKT